jgi:type I restriction-modification system DNA methylase subunit
LVTLVSAIEWDLSSSDVAYAFPELYDDIPSFSSCDSVIIINIDVVNGTKLVNKTTLHEMFIEESFKAYDKLPTLPKPAYESFITNFKNQMNEEYLESYGCIIE